MNWAGLKALSEGSMDNFITASTPGGIEKQEAEAQKELCQNPRFPKKHFNCTREDFEKLGIKYLDEFDDLFINVELPEGWSIQPTDHSMWNNLIDQNNIKQAMIFYKGAFYDRKSYICIKLIK